MFLEGPLLFINVPTFPFYIYITYVAAGIAIGGIGGALIMPSAMCALIDATEGIYPPSKDSEAKNAMGALISLAFGTGNFLGTMSGGYLFDYFKSNECLKFRPENREVNKLYHQLFSNSPTVTSANIS